MSIRATASNSLRRAAVGSSAAAAAAAACSPACQLTSLRLPPQSRNASYFSAGGIRLRGQVRAPRSSPGVSVSATSHRCYSTSGSIQDPEHPNGLWYHTVSEADGKVTYAVSYLSTPPSSDSSPSILALLSVPTGQDVVAFARSNPDAVQAQKPFWDLLHRTLKEDIVGKEKDAILVQEADLRENGWAHLADERQPLMPGRIPTPDAIIASVSFSDCKIAPDSYTPNDTYRAITREEGFTVLRQVWLDAVKAALKRSN